MITHLSGGNCTREEHERYEREYEAAVAEGWTPWNGTVEELPPRRNPLRLLVNRAVRELEPCPRPMPTPERTARAVQHRLNTAAHRANRTALQPWQFPLFDDEPAVRCKGACRA
jgi:hypothetical protein